MAELTKETEEKIAQLQLLEQSLQSFLVQKQNMQTQLFEIETALKELGKTDNAYRIIGNIMVKSSRDELKKDLEQKKSMIDLRIKNIEKQEEKIREKVKSLQQEVLQKMK
ncbi:MAG: prefoldin subunit beta [Candidatus Woesearchaeota archaeon]|nr:prefoldin subunit beta [Candidatus Woesearchaeota archaeon]